MTTHGPPLLILGASARAAAFSALRAGLTPMCIDLFADEDLRQVASAHRITTQNYPHGFIADAQQAPPSPWMYTGGLENHLALVDAITRGRPLWGNPGPVLRRVRDPRQVATVLNRHNLACPAVSLEPPNENDDRPWLIKPRRGAGGHGINSWRHGMKTTSKGWYWHERIEGESVAALYLGQDAQACRLIGVTRQLVGEPWLHARPFQYCGSIGPLTLPSATIETFERLGQALTLAFGLRGLFGVDCILRDGLPWPVEINPRYPASAELFDLNCGRFLVAEHARCFSRPSEGGGLGGESEVRARDTVPLTPDPSPPSTGERGASGHWAKAIFYARRSLVFPAQGPWTGALRNPMVFDADPWFADIPASGTAIAAGQPILTYFRRGASPTHYERHLQETADDLDRWLFNR